MKIISFHSFGDADQLYFTEASEPKASEYQVVVKIKATALNRADILQRRGKYPPPAGESQILGEKLLSAAKRLHDGVLVIRFAVSFLEEAMRNTLLFTNNMLYPFLKD